MRTPTADLSQAWSWTCDNCATQNWLHAEPCEVTPDDVEELRELLEEEGLELDIAQGVGGFNSVKPPTVTCSNCKQTHKVD